MDVDQAIKQITEFKDNQSVKQLVIDHRNSFERFQIHQYAKKLGLISTSVSEEKSTRKHIVISREPLSGQTVMLSATETPGQSEIHLVPTNQCQIDQITISDEIIITFISLTKFPVSVPKPEFVEYYLRELDPYYGCYAKFIQYIHEVKESGGITKYRRHIDEISRTIIHYIKTDHSFEPLRRKPGTKPKVIMDLKKSIYKPKNNGKIFISIDLIDAFFRIIKYYYPDTFEGCDQWSTYISKFTKYNFIINSKSLRKLILGKSGSGQGLIDICDRFMEKVYIDLKNMIEENKELVKELVIVSINVDEIVIEINESLEHFEQIKSFMDHRYPGMFRTQVFKLHQLQDTTYYVKQIIGQNVKVEFKCCHPMVLMQCIRYWKGQKCEPNDFKYVKKEQITDHPVIFK